MKAKQDTIDMSGITVVEFENSLYPEETYLSSELEDGPPYTVHGIALGAGDVTKGKSGIRKKWPAEELKRAADTLQGTNLALDHGKSASDVIGKVTKSGYKEGTGVVYEAELYDEDLAEKIQNGLLEVSVRGAHKDVDDLSEDPDSAALVVEDIQFKDLSIVPSGASPSNTLEMGEHDELSEAELSSFTDTLTCAELAEIEPGMWVQWDDGSMHGITIGQVQDGEVEVDLYEESDGQWRSIEETEMVSTDGMSEWDVDEDNIGPAPDKDEDESESDEDEEENATSDELAEKGDKVSWESSGGTAQGVVVDRKTDGCFSDKIDGDQKICADDDAVLLIEIVKEGERTGTMVAHKEATVNTADFNLAEDEDSDSDEGVNPPEFEEGDIVEWQVNPSMRGRIVHAPMNQDIVMVEVMEEVDGEMQSSGFTVTAGYSDLKKVEQDGSMEENSAVDRGEFVKWRDHDSNWRHGQIIEIDQDGRQMVATLRRFTKSGDKLDETEQKPLQGLDKWDAPEMEESSSMETDDTDQTSQTTVTDLINVLASVTEQASTTKDVPTEDAEPSHQPMGSMKGLFNKFMESGGSADSTLSEFIQWLDDQDELSHSPEGADSALDNPVAIRRMKENDAAYMAFVWQDEDTGELAQSFDGYPEAAKENAQMALDAREETDNPNDCGTSAGWNRANQLASGESLSADTVKRMAQFNRHRQNSEMDDEEGKADCGWMMWKAWGGDEGVDWAKRTVEQEELADIEELQEYEMHTPDWSGTTESEWSSPDMEDFDTDDLSEIASHFLISMGGFPPENYSDLKLPVVEPNGDLNVNALAAVKGGRGVSAVDGLSSDMEDKIVDWVNETANSEFDKNWGEEEMAEYGNVPEGHRFESKEDAMSKAEDLGLEGVHEMEFDGETMYVPGESHEAYMDTVSEQSKHADESKEDGDEMAAMGVRVLPGDDLRQGSSGASESDSMTTYNITTMNEQIEEKLSELDDPVAVEGDELADLQEKADRFEEMSENLEALRERTEIIDEVDRTQVEELRDSDDAMVVESARFEELQSEADQVKGVYAAQLSEKYEAFDSEELADKFSIEELREKYEDQFGSIEELADSTEAEPQSQDPSEEELEEESSEGSEEAELADAVAQKQAEIRQKMELGGD